MQFLWMLSDIRTPFLNHIMQIITYLGQEVVIIAVICLLYWCIDKRFAYLLAFTYFTAGLMVQTLKVTFRIPRPWILDPAFKPVESAVPGATGYSFPSGHTQGATCLFMPLSLRARTWWMKVLCILAFILIGFSRMYLGCHTPKDVAVSMLLSVLICTLIWRFQWVLLDSDKYLRQIAVILILISFAVSLYALYLSGTQVISSKYAADCCKAGGAGIGFAAGWYIERTKLNFDTHTRHLWSQMIKLAAGLAGALIIKEGFGFIFGGSVLADMAKYFILVLWVLVFYPYIFNRIGGGNA